MYTQKIIRNSEWSIQRMLHWQFSYIHFFTRYFFNFEEVLANNCGYFKIHNTQKESCVQKNFIILNVIDKTLENFLWQIFESVDFLPAAPPSDRFCSKFTFLKRKKLSFVCWQHKSSRAIHNGAKGLMKSYLNFYNDMISHSAWMDNIIKNK